MSSNPENAVGTPSAFVLIGGPGNDRIVPLVGWQPDDGPVVDGGSGRDVLDLHQNPAVKVDLAAGVVRASSGRSTVESFESVVGTRHADVIRGDGHGNRLDGGRGNDVHRRCGGRTVPRSVAPDATAASRRSVAPADVRR